MVRGSQTAGGTAGQGRHHRETEKAETRGQQNASPDDRSPQAMTENLILKRASTSRASGEWNDDDFDVLADGVVVGRIFKVHAASVGTPWMWTLAFGQH